MEYAPIALFVYNRLSHAQRTIEALKNNQLASESEIFIFSDGGKNEEDWKKVQAVRDYIKSLTGFKKVNIKEQEKNKGLANSIISGVTEVVNKYGRIIVVEDDILTSPYFLNYMNDALEMYNADEQVCCISGYVYPIPELPKTFFIKGADCWGWATWEPAWKIFNANGRELLSELKEKKIDREFDWKGTYPYMQMLKDQIDGKNNSWAIRWYASVFLRDGLCLYPGKSFVKNIGLDGSGTHCGSMGEVDRDEFDHAYSTIRRIELHQDLIALKKFHNFFTKDRTYMHFDKAHCINFFEVFVKLSRNFMSFFSKLSGRTKNGEYGFFGDYSSWDEVKKISGGYEAENILAKTLESTLKVKRGEAVFERDSFIFDSVQYSCGLLASLFKVATENGNVLKVLDFGGALGSHYFQNKSFLSPVEIKKWIVVEQPHYVRMGKEKISDGTLDFAYSIDEVTDTNVLVLSSVLQYLPQPYEWLKKFMAKGIEFIILDRTAFSTEGRDRLTLQKVPPQIYEAEYPAWFLNKEKVFSMLEEKYKLLIEFEDHIDEVHEIPSEFKGALFKLVSS